MHGLTIIMVGSGRHHKSNKRSPLLYYQNKTDQSVRNSQLNKESQIRFSVGDGEYLQLKCL